MVTREDGWIAVKYLQNVPHVVFVKGMGYAFVVQHNVNLTWVDPDHLDAMMAIKGGCCGKKKQKYRLANESDVFQWSK